MPVISLDRVSLAFGHVQLLDQVNWVIEPGSKIGLIGRNGAGKSSLLRVLAGETVPDDGQVRRESGMRLAYVAQEPVLDPHKTVYETVAEGLGAISCQLLDYHRVTQALAQPDADHDSLLAHLQILQTALEAEDGWRLDSRVEAALSRLGLPADALTHTLSGGLKKRVALARALVSEPALLLLDEPTNHLDLTSIEWLEQLIREFAGAVVVITHDRRFLDHVAQQIVALDRGYLSSYAGGYANYRRIKEEQLAIEAVEQAKFDKFLAQEEVWIRKGVEARRTRNEGRVRRLERLRVARGERRNQQGQVQLALDAGQRSGKLVAELEQVGKSLGGRVLVRDFSTRIQRGDKVGLIGPNGAGKTTLIRLMLGDLAPDTGSVRLGTKLEVAYFDQFRTQLDEEAILADIISPGSDYVEIGGQRKHVISYLEDFLFAPARARSPVKSLSGGERNRLLLARLFARPANLLVLDEPTNDLDMDTLELLEALLQDYDGTVLLVSHDREFLDQVVTQVIVSEGDGVWQTYVGGYDDWLIQHQRASALAAPVASAATRAAKNPAASVKPVAASARKPGGGRRLTLEQVMEQIATLESRQQAIAASMADSSLYSGNETRRLELQNELHQIEAAMEAALQLWEALEEG